MSSKPTAITANVYNYLLAHNHSPHPILEAVAAATAQRPDAVMQISPVQATLMAQLTRLAGGNLALEIGCYTGYSAIATASGLRPGGRLITCDINPETAAIANHFFREAGYSDRINLRLGPALATLEQLQEEFGLAAFDQVFIDADKGNYLAYYEAALPLLRPGGMLLVDNTLWSGKVADPAELSDADTLAIKAFNDAVAADERVTSALLPIGDGLTLLLKRPS